MIKFAIVLLLISFSFHEIHLQQESSNELNLIDRLFNSSNKEGKVRLVGGRTLFEGNVQINHFDYWGSICDDEWDINDADVVCRQLGFVLGAMMATSNNRYGQTEKLIWMDNVLCDGDESSLSECRFNGWQLHDCETNESAGVICRINLNQIPDRRILTDNTNQKPNKNINFNQKTSQQQLNLPDLIPDAKEIETSSFIEDRSILFLQCAMEENCLSRSAYEIDKNNPEWILETRKLLRFTASIKNIGKIDFRPFKEKTKWIWHSCHQHYHSMEVFATFNILDYQRKPIAQGHKASFCLEDNECHSGKIGKYQCENYGDQGISVDCVDIYKYDLDCQWIDITDIPFGFYHLKVIINPEMKVPELSFENNAVLCSFLYREKSSIVENCTLTSLL